ncbi:MAG: hypothetical protein NG747_15905 [Candidatus Brocadia sp.]|nr:hypothetical protein [Candidatus Brocadia sp.]
MNDKTRTNKVCPCHPETIHQYLKVNWQNIIIMKSRIGEVKEFAEKMRKLLVEQKINANLSFSSYRRHGDV